MERKQMSLKRIVLLCVKILMVAGFCFEVRECLSKFFAGKTTIAMQMESLLHIELPVISLCPGFKPKGLEPAIEMFDPHLSVSFFDIHPEKGEKAAVRDAKNTTFIDTQLVQSYVLSKAQYSYCEWEAR